MSERCASARLHILEIDPQNARKEEKNSDDYRNAPNHYNQTFEPA
jgi:hypothetical protein